VLRVIDMLNSSRRMMFENAIDGFEYTGRGTCFICRYHGHDFAVTAGHVTRDYNADAIRILFHQGARDFVPHNAQITIRVDEDQSGANHEDDDSDWRDIAIFPLERSLYDDNQFNDQAPYPIPSRHLIWQPDLGGHFIMRGFPHDLSAIDYDDFVLREQAVQLEADLIGPATMQHCFQIRFRDLSPCSTLDGLSGAPVFWVGDDQPRSHCLAGMMLRATYASATGYFVDANVIVSALEKALAESDIAK
jgi:hypothetical protein|tara:strand:- start:2707 stop:3450 length:744 start_codon:yes stop_codon:yes gene_type:complete